MSTKTFFLLTSSFNFLNWFKTKTIWCHNACSIILPSHNSLFLILIRCIYNLRITFLILKNFFLALNENFFQAICSRSTYIRFFLREHESVNWNELKKLSTERSIGCRLPSESAMNGVKHNSSTKSKIGDNILFATSFTFIKSEVKEVSKWQVGPPYLVFKAYWLHFYWLFQKGSISTKILHHALVYITLFIPDPMSLEIISKFVNLLR